MTSFALSHSFLFFLFYTLDSFCEYLPVHSWPVRCLVSFSHPPQWSVICSFHTTNFLIRTFLSLRPSRQDKLSRRCLSAPYFVLCVIIDLWRLISGRKHTYFTDNHTEVTGCRSRRRRWLLWWRRRTTKNHIENAKNVTPIADNKHICRVQFDHFSVYRDCTLLLHYTLQNEWRNYVQLPRAVLLWGKDASHHSFSSVPSPIHPQFSLLRFMISFRNLFWISQLLNVVALRSKIFQQ